MPKFLVQASYTLEGAKGLKKEGGSSRAAVVDQMVKGLGGRLNAFYFAFGKTDVYAIIDLPDTPAAAAASLAINTSGAVSLSLVPLITPEEMDAASKKQVQYRAPGR